MEHYLWGIKSSAGRNKTVLYLERDAAVPGGSSIPIAENSIQNQ